MPPIAPLPVFARRSGSWLIDLVLLSGLVGLVFAAIGVEHQWTGHLRTKVDIDLSISALPWYGWLSLSRGLLAYVLSLGFTLVYGYWAARHHAAERVLVPMLDILQSIPVLGFMPGVVLALISIFPDSNVGLEFAAVVMIFTGQAWNMTFSLYQSLKAIPREQSEAASIFRFSWWQRMRWVEMPNAALGLVWNSMMSMAGGWFFLMVSEAFVLGDKDFRLPGLGSYMSVASERGDTMAMIWGSVTMIVLIVALDQLLWRPIVVWAQRFRADETAGGERESSWFLDFLKRSWFIRRVSHVAESSTAATPAPLTAPVLKPVTVAVSRPMGPYHPANLIGTLAMVAMVGALLWGGWLLLGLILKVGATAWAEIGISTSLTAGRVFGAVLIGTLWALPAGIIIGLNPRIARFAQPVVQVAASYPAPMLFPFCLIVFHAIGLPLNWGAMVLMLLGTQWYILFNVIAGAMAIPADLREAARAFRFSRWQRFWRVYAPGLFPALVTGWVTAAGGAWNASIVAEYLTYHGEVHMADGLGSFISRAAEKADFPLLAAAVATMAAVVVLINNVLWRRLYRIASERFSITK